MKIRLRRAKPILQPLLDRNADLGLLDAKTIFLKPLHHCLLTFSVYRPLNINSTALQWNIIELFWPNQRLDFVTGHRNYLPRSSFSEKQSWEWSDPTMVEEAIFAAETEALPLMRSMQHFETYAAYYYFLKKRSYQEDDESRLVLDIAMGDLDTAEELCRQLLPKHEGDFVGGSFIEQALRNKVVTVAEPLFARNRGALAEILRGWERANVRGTVFEPYWEPMPFPLERQVVLGRCPEKRLP